MWLQVQFPSLSLSLLVLQVFLALTGNPFQIQTSAAEVNFCGMKDPDPEKTCVSLRLPWQEEPIYFCTEKENIKYKSQCGSHGMHCPSQWSREVLLLATPWDCCPLSSIPDNCVNAQCPPKPMNRTCETIPPPEDNPWDCCPKYFCDENGRTQKDCHFKQLEPGCTTPPKGKTNCVPFFDQHGCCTQYQCDGDGKPGMCPMQVAAMKYSANALGSETVNTIRYLNSTDGSMGPSSNNNGMQMQMPMRNSTMPMESEMTGTTSASQTMAMAATDIQPQIKAAPQDLQNSSTTLADGGSLSGPGPSTNFNDNGIGGTHGGNSKTNVMGSGIQSQMVPPHPYPHHPPPPPSGASYPSYGQHYVGNQEKASYSISVDYPSPAGGGGHMHIPCVGDFNCPGGMKCCSHDIASYSDNSALMKNTHPTHGFCMDPVIN